MFQGKWVCELLDNDDSGQGSSLIKIYDSTILLLDEIQIVLDMRDFSQFSYFLSSQMQVIR